MGGTFKAPVLSPPADQEGCYTGFRGRTGARTPTTGEPTAFKKTADSSEGETRR